MCANDGRGRRSDTPLGDEVSAGVFVVDECADIELAIVEMMLGEDGRCLAGREM